MTSDLSNQRQAGPGRWDAVRSDHTETSEDAPRILMDESQQAALYQRRLELAQSASHTLEATWYLMATGYLDDLANSVDTMQGDMALAFDMAGRALMAAMSDAGIGSDGARLSVVMVLDCIAAAAAMAAKVTRDHGAERPWLQR